MARVEARRVAALAFFILALLIGTQETRAGELSLSAAFESLKPALVYVRLPKQQATGFVVSVTGTSAYFVTVDHVFEDNGPLTRGEHVRAWVGNDKSVEYTAELVVRDKSHDIALLRIPAPRSPIAVTFGGAPAESAAIALAGYNADSSNRFEYSEHPELSAVSTLGSVSQRISDGRLLTTAYSERGESGGPLFDSTGHVFGLNLGKSEVSRKTFYAQGAGAITDLLAAKHIPYDAADFLSAPIPEAPAPSKSSGREDFGFAHRLVLNVTTSLQARDEKNNVLSVDPAPAIQSLGTMATTYFDSQLVQTDTHTADPSEFGALATRNKCIGTLNVDYFLSAGPISTGMINGLLNAVNAMVDMTLVDSRGTAWAIGIGKKTQRRYFTFTSPELANVLTSLTSTAFNDLREGLGTNPSVGENFGRYGIPLGNGERRAFFQLEKSGDVARVTGIISAGTAAIAGLQVGDSVYAINGVDVGPLSNEQMIQLLEKSSSGRRLDLATVGADGRKVLVSFYAQTIREYVEARNRHGR